MELQTLPIGEQSFVKLRTKNRLYVDKTPALYNPFSLMCALSKRVMDSYWFESGTPTMLVELFQRNHYPLPNLEESIDTAALDSKDGSGDSIIPLLYQSGYLSISRSDEESQQTWLTFPNKEVNEGFFRFLLPYYSSVQKNRTKAAINSFIDDIRSGNVEQFLQRLQSFFADFQYDAQTTPESHFRNVLYILCKLMGLQVDAEYQTSDGRIDLLLRTDKFVYIIECKIDSTAKIALQQIKDKEYALPWALDGREKVLIGINFSTTSRRPDDWIIERGDGTIVCRSEQVSGGSKLAASWQQVGSKLAVSRDMSIEAVVQQMRKYVIACSAKEICADFGFKDVYKFRRDYINPLVAAGFLAMTQPDAPQSSKQKYFLSPKGLALLAELTKE